MTFQVWVALFNTGLDFLNGDLKIKMIYCSLDFSIWNYDNKFQLKTPLSWIVSGLRLFWISYILVYGLLSMRSIDEFGNRLWYLVTFDFMFVYHLILRKIFLNIWYSFICIDIGSNRVMLKFCVGFCTQH